MPDQFNPNSINAVLATVLTRLDAQDKMLTSILEQTQKTNGRVNALEANENIKRGVYLAVCSVWSIIVSVATALACHYTSSVGKP